MPEIPRTKFNSPWTVAVIEAALNDVSSAKGSSESLTAALNAMRSEINSLSGGVHLKGAVDYYNDLPASPSEGDAYTVRYQGTSGTDPLGVEYAWATYQGTPQWIPIGVDPSVFAKATDEAEDRAALVELVDNGDKQMLDLSKATSVAASAGVSYTLNSDGSLRVTWSISEGGTGVLRFRGLTMRTEAEPLFLSGCPSGGGLNTYRCDLRQGSDSSETTFAIDNGEGAEFSQPSGDFKFVVRVRQTTGDVTFYPMICTKVKRKISQAYQPYRPSWQEMWDAIQALQSGGNRALTMQTAELEEQEER